MRTCYAGTRYLVPGTRVGKYDIIIRHCCLYFIKWWNATLCPAFSQIDGEVPETWHVYFRDWKSRSNHTALHSTHPPCNYQSSCHTAYTAAPFQHTSAVQHYLFYSRSALASAPAGSETTGVLIADTHDWRHCDMLLLFVSSKTLFKTTVPPT